MSEERPLLIAADDSDQMDPASLAIVAFALGRMDSQAVAALTSADGHGASNPLVAISDGAPCSTDSTSRRWLPPCKQRPPPIGWCAAWRRSPVATRRSPSKLVRSLSLTSARAGGLPERSGASGSRRHCPRPASRGAEHRGTHGAVIAADTTDDVAVVRGALHALHAGDPLADLERAGLVAMAGASLRVRRPMLEVVRTTGWTLQPVGPCTARWPHR